MATTDVAYGYVSTPLGQLHYAEAGSGTPVVLLHQTPRSHDEFREVLPLLGRTRRAIAMDMYGFGQSAKPAPGPQTIEQYAAGVLAFADALGLDRFVVAGHHTGMFVASEVAASAPDRVAAVVLSSGEYGDAAFRASRQTDPGTDEEGDSRAVDVARPRDDGRHLLKMWGKRRPLYPADRPDLLDRFVRDALAPDVDPAEGPRAVGRYLMEDRVGLVTAPVLVIAATADPVSYPHTPAVVAAYPNAASVELVEIEGGQIPLMECHAQPVVSAVEAFLTPLGL